MKKLILSVVFWSLVLAGFIFPPVPAGAYSARTIGMGTAFTGLADDAAAAWWNPAGLPYVKKSSFSYTRLLGEKEMNFYGPDDFVAICVPFGEKLEGAVGVALYSDQNIGDVIAGGLTYSGAITDRTGVVSYSQMLFDDFSASFSLKFSQRRKSYVLAGQTFSSEAQVTAYDFGFLWKMAPDMQLGLLVQNANAPEFNLFGKKEPLYSNIRPGFAWLIQPKIRLTADIDDLFGETDGQPTTIADNFSAGCEFEFYTGAKLRVGLIHLNSSTPTERVVTAGVGIAENNLSVDMAIAYPIAREDAGKKLFIFCGLGYLF